jgi:hypothetical protein
VTWKRPFLFSPLSKFPWWQVLPHRGVWIFGVDLFLRS